MTAAFTVTAIKKRRKKKRKERPLEMSRRKGGTIVCRRHRQTQRDGERESFREGKQRTEAEKNEEKVRK